MPRAAIDIGSNSILLTVVEDDGQVLHDEARIVGLGKGLGDRGLFAPDRIAAATEVLRTYVEVARTHGVDAMDIKAVATSAARRAMNAETFFERIQRTIGLRVRIISGDDEARFTWRGALAGLLLPEGPRLVVDLGGGSTELVLGLHEDDAERASLELGSARLTERFLPPGPEGRHPAEGLAALTGYVDAELSRFPLEPRPASVIGVAGTVTTLLALHLGLPQYDGEMVHGSALSRHTLHRFVRRFVALTGDERRAQVAIAPARADFLVAGAVVLERVLHRAQAAALVVSDRGLRFGVLAPSS